MGSQPFAGDVQIRDFAFFMHNQIKWKKATSFVEKVDKIEGLRLRGELENSVRLLGQRTEVVKSVGFAATLESRKKTMISSCEDWIALNILEAI